MQTLSDLQAAFRVALLSGDSSPLKDVLVGSAAERGFRVHRNNVLGSLVETIESTYPVVRQLLGREFFRAMALKFVQQHPPQVPRLSGYGGQFGDFLVEVTCTMPYLAEVARFEWARVEASLAPEAAALESRSLQHISSEQTWGLKLILHPSVRLLASRFPIWQLWEAHQSPRPDLGHITLDGAGENILIVRCGKELKLRLLSSGELAFLRALQQEEALGPATEMARSAEPGFSLQVELEICLLLGVFCAVELSVA